MTDFLELQGATFHPLGESGLKGVCWEVAVDVSFIAAPVRGMDPEYFAKKYFDFRNARLLSS